MKAAVESNVQINWDAIQQSIKHQDLEEQTHGLVEMYRVARSAAALTEVTHHCTKILGDYLKEERSAKHTALALTTIALFGSLSEDEQLTMKMDLTPSMCNKLYYFIIFHFRQNKISNIYLVHLTFLTLLMFECAKLYSL